VHKLANLAVFPTASPISPEVATLKHRSRSVEPGSTPSSPGATRPPRQRTETTAQRSPRERKPSRPSTAPSANGSVVSLLRDQSPSELSYIYQRRGSAPDTGTASAADLLDADEALLPPRAAFMRNSHQKSASADSALRRVESVDRALSSHAASPVKTPDDSQRKKKNIFRGILARR
jgi:hypothetical protein